MAEEKDRQRKGKRLECLLISRMNLERENHCPYKHCPFMLFFGVKTSSLLIINLHLPGHKALYFTSYCFVQTWWNEKKKEDPYHHGAWCFHSWSRTNGSLSRALTRHKQILFTQRRYADATCLLWMLKQEVDKIKMTSCWGEQSRSLLYSDWLLSARHCSQMQKVFLRTVQEYEELFMPRWGSADMCSLRTGHMQHRQACAHCLSHWRAPVLIAKWVKQKRVQKKAERDDWPWKNKIRERSRHRASWDMKLKYDTTYCWPCFNSSFCFRCSGAGFLQWVIIHKAARQWSFIISGRVAWWLHRQLRVKVQPTTLWFLNNSQAIFYIQYVSWSGVCIVREKNLLWINKALHIKK